MAALSREQILAANDLRMESVTVPQWGGEVHLIELTDRAKAQWQMDNAEVKEVADGGFDKDGRPTYRFGTILKQDQLSRAKAIALVAVNPETKDRLFQDDKEVIELSGKSSTAIDLLYEKFLSMNGLSKKAEEDLKKNSETTTGASSSSGLPAH